LIRDKSIAMFASGDIRATGGSLIATQELAKVLASQNKIHMISVDNIINCPLPSLPENIDVKFTWYPRNPKIMHIISPLLAIRDGLRFEQLDADVFHFNNCCDLGIISRIVRRPSVVVLHGDLLLLASETGVSKHALKEFYLLPLFRRSLKEAEVIVGADSTMINYMKLIFPYGTEKTVIIPNGVDVSRFGTASQGRIRAKYDLKDKMIIMYLGRLTAFRDHDDILYALPDILKACPNTILFLVGGGEREGELKEIVKTLNMDQHVVFAGDLPSQEMPEYYADADIIFNAAIPQKYGIETCDNSMRRSMDDNLFMSSSIATLEGMASGKALVCLKPKVMMKKEMVDCNDVGILLPIHQKELLVETIIKLIGNDNLRDSIGSNARHYILHNRSLKIIAEKMGEVYEMAMRKYETG